MEVQLHTALLRQVILPMSEWWEWLEMILERPTLTVSVPEESTWKVCSVMNPDPPSLKGKYHENFNRRDTLDIQLNVFENFRPDLPQSYIDSNFVLLGNIHPALQMHVLDQLSGESFILADTIDLWIETERKLCYP